MLTVGHILLALVSGGSLFALSFLMQVYFGPILGYHWLWSPKKPSFNNDVVLITGGVQGIGRVLAERFLLLRKGMRAKKVIVLDVIKPPVDFLPDIEFVECDVSDQKRVKEAIESIEKKHGRITILVNNAGIVKGKRFLELTEEDINQTIDVNLKGVIWATRAVLPGMIEANYGYIVNMSSSMAFAGTVRVSDYAASKSAIYTLNEAIRMELRDAGVTGVKTVVVCPGHVTTGLFDGVKMKFPLLTPSLSPEFIVLHILYAIQFHEPEVWIPFFVRGIPILRLLPTSVYDFLQRLMGVSTGMVEFRGRLPGDPVDYPRNQNKKAN